MKVCIALLALVAFAAAQNHFGDLIHHEVAALIKADPNLTVDHCTTKCDALFDLIDANDEQHTDDMCAHACDCEINKSCGQHTHQPHSTPQHHTHPPHPTHPPHGHHP